MARSVWWCSGEVIAILDGRSEDYAVRASVNSEYTLTGGVICVHCGSHYVGTAATGRNGRYRYYTCHTRQRYGAAACQADRLPADELETQVAASLVATMERTDLVQSVIEAVSSTRSKALAAIAKEIANAADELAATDAKINPIPGRLREQVDVRRRNRRPG